MAKYLKHMIRLVVAKFVADAFGRLMGIDIARVAA